MDLALRGLNPDRFWPSVDFGNPKPCGAIRLIRVGCLPTELLEMLGYTI